MTAWPTDNISTINLDVPTDDPSQARAEIYNAMQRIKEVIGARNENDGVCPLGADGMVPDGLMLSSRVLFTQEGSGAVPRTLYDKGLEFVSIKDYGAVADGVTDDTLAIQAAGNSCGENGVALWFPKGTYIISATLNWTTAFSLYIAAGATLKLKDGTDLTGGGQFGSFIRMSNGAGIKILNFGGKLDMNWRSGAKAMHAIVLEKNVTDFEIAGHHIYDYYGNGIGVYSYWDGATLYPSDRGNIHHNIIQHLTSGAQEGIGVNGCNGINITDNWISNPVDDCIAVHGQSDGLFQPCNNINIGNNILQASARGILIEGDCSQINITNNIIKSTSAINARPLILLQNASSTAHASAYPEGIVIHCNNIYIPSASTTIEGVYIAIGQQITVSNNLIKADTSTNVLAVEVRVQGSGLIEHIQQISITDNSIINCAQGIKLATSGTSLPDEIQIVRNQLIDCGSEIDLSATPTTEVWTFAGNTANGTGHSINWTTASGPIQDYGGNYWNFSSAIFATTWNRRIRAGHILYNTQPSEGTPHGWVCIASGQGSSVRWAPLAIAPGAISASGDSTLNLYDNGKSYDNAAASGVSTITLPAALAGMQFRFTRDASYAFRVDPNGSESIRGGGAGKYLELDTNGDSVSLACLQDGYWEIIGGYGAYSFEV